MPRTWMDEQKFPKDVHDNLRGFWPLPEMRTRHWRVQPFPYVYTLMLSWDQNLIRTVWSMYEWWDSSAKKSAQPWEWLNMKAPSTYIRQVLMTAKQVMCFQGNFLFIRMQEHTTDSKTLPGRWKASCKKQRNSYNGSIPMHSPEDPVVTLLIYEAFKGDQFYVIIFQTGLCFILTSEFTSRSRDSAATYIQNRPIRSWSVQEIEIGTCPKC